MKKGANFWTVGIIIIISSIFMLQGCDESGDPAPTPNGNNRSYPLIAQSGDNISGQVIFAEYSDGSVNFVIELNNTFSGNEYPAYLYFDNAIDGDQVVLTLEPVNGATGGSQLRATAFDDGTTFTFGQLLGFDGHVKILDSDNSNNILAAGDIGANSFTGNEKVYNISEVANSGASGVIRLRERLNQETLLEITSLDAYQAHIHVNSAVEGGPVAISLNPGVESYSATNISELDAGAGGQEITYSDLLNFDGHINIHDPVDTDLILGNADIGGNELNGTEMAYQLKERNNSAVSGTITFYERKSGETLARIELVNTIPNAMHPAHLHIGTAAQEDAGLKAVILNPVDGNSGLSLTHIDRLDAAVGGTPLSFEDLLVFDGYINIHTSMADLTLLAQTDIGENALTGNSVTFTLDNIPGVTGTATLFERNNGRALLEISISGAAVTGGHPAHIHGGSVAEGPGPIEITLSEVDSFGYSRTSVESDDNGTSLDYSALTTYDGYINVHESASNLGVIIAQGDFGSNAP